MLYEVLISVAMKHGWLFAVMILLPMRLRSAALFATLTLPLPGTTAQCESLPSADPEKVAREVSKLSAEQWRDRRDAVEWLIDAGPSAELQLRRLIDRTTNPEARMRAQRALARIGRIRRIEPALITLVLDHVDAGIAFQRVADVEGAELKADLPDLLSDCHVKVTARFEGQTYWQVMLDLCRQTSLELRNVGGGIVVSHKASAEAAGDAIGSSGAFLTCARLTRWSGDPQDLGRSVRIEVHAEPRAELLRADWHVALTEAIDQRGQSLRPLAESGMSMGGSVKLADGYSWAVPLRPAASADARLRHLRGSVDVTLAEQMVSGQAPDHAGDHTLGGPMPIHLACGAVSASVLRVVRDGTSWTMEMQVDADPAEVDWEAVMQSMGEGGVRAFDAGGRELALRSFSRAGGGPSNQVQFRWQGPLDPKLPLPGDPFKLTWRLPGKTVRATVPFDLEDVGLVER